MALQLNVLLFISSIIVKPIDVCTPTCVLIIQVC